MTASAPAVRPIPGFESTAYAYLDGKVAWIGANARIQHPRNAARPWQPAPFVGDAQGLRQGAQTCLGLLDTLPPKGLLLWLAGRPLPFPLDHAGAHLDAVRTALAGNDILAFEAAALRLLGLGPGLTPSGDDFVGGVLFALAHAPRTDWQPRLPALKTRIREAAQTRTHAISAALLDDLMQGASYGALHDMLSALQSNSAAQIARALQGLLGLGATSGADMLAGLLLALTGMPARRPHPRPLPKAEGARKSDPP